MLVGSFNQKRGKKITVIFLLKVQHQMPQAFFITFFFLIRKETDMEILASKRLYTVHSGTLPKIPTKRIYIQRIKLRH